jgi:mono/diheme cytochrome c family protein
MRVLKTALLISSAVLFSIACSTSETTNHNSNHSAPAPAAATNAAPTSAAANTNSAPASYASANANTNQPAKAADSKPAASATPASNVDGASLYTANKCATCHGADGKGKIKDARDFTDTAWQNKQSDADLAAAIRNGKKPMPPYGDKLNADEIRALVAYVRAFGKK